MRRSMVFPLGLCMLMSMPALAQEPAEPTKTEHVFDITREGDKIGTDVIEITKTGDTTTIKSTTHIEVTVAFIRAYLFEHTAVETWSKGHFVSYKATTNDNGTKYQLSAKVAGDKMDLTVNGTHNQVPQVVMPASLWNADFITSTQLIDTDKGKIMSIAVQDMGDEAIDFGGAQIQAHHYKITGDFPRDVWLQDGVPIRISLRGSDHSLIVSDMRR